MTRRPPSNPDAEVATVVEALKAADPDGKRFAGVIRNTFDQLLDGQRTGRYAWEQLHKTEKTHAGTLIEINLQREFNPVRAGRGEPLLADGAKLDYNIRGIEVDCKYSQTQNGWMIPSEATGHLCLVITASDAQGRWSAGVVRASEEFLGTGSNRDGKRTLNADGRQSIRWIFQNHALKSNIYLLLDRAQTEQILDPDIHGAEGVRRLFRIAERQVIGRAAVATAAQQDDFMKRVRYNSGARSSLQPEGILILGHEAAHQRIAAALRLPVPEKGEFVSARVFPTAKKVPASVVIDGRRWRLADPGDPAVVAPLLPKGEEPDA